LAETVSTNQFKNGMHVELDGQVWRIVEFQHVKPGKGGAFVRTKLKNLDSGSVVDRTFRAGEKMPRVRTETKSVQYLYDAGDEVVFMDTGNYEQISLPHTDLENQLPYMQPSSEVMLLLVNGRPSAVDLPAAVELAVVQTEPGVKGDTVSNVTKPATLETARSSRCRSSSTSATASRSTRARRATSHGPSRARPRRHQHPAPLAGAPCPADAVVPGLELAEILDNAGFAYLEISGGGCFDSAVRRGVESPWERIRAIRRAARRRSPWRCGDGFWSARVPLSRDLVSRFVASAADSGIDIFRIHDPLNDLRICRTRRKRSTRRGRSSPSASCTARARAGDTGHPPRAGESPRRARRVARPHP
jgi:elongation factor P